MELTTAETIQNRTKELIDKSNALVLGQCLTAVGWVGGTVPPLEGSPNIIELSMADVAGGGIAVGAALDETRPVIYVVRYQGFLWYNAISIVNYAAKSYELFEVPCPLIVRAIGMEGSIGPVAGNSHLSLLLRMPGINVFAPMTGAEWDKALDYHLAQKRYPTVIGENRLSYKLTSKELQDQVDGDSRITLIAIGASRLCASKAKQQLDELGVKSDLFNLFELQPLSFPKGFLESVQVTRKCLVIDSDFQDWGPCENIAFKITQLVQGHVYTLGLPKKSAGFSRITDNLTPSVRQIVERVLNILEFGHNTSS